METQDILKNLREKNHLTQEEMATRIHVTRQAVSRWETGDTLPNTETLKLFAIPIALKESLPHGQCGPCCSIAPMGRIAKSQTSFA